MERMSTFGAQDCFLLQRNNVPVQASGQSLGRFACKPIRDWDFLSPVIQTIGKTTRLFRYDLNQIPYVCTAEAINRFKGLDLIYRVPEELWMEICDTVQEAVTKTTPKKKKRKKAKWLRRLYK